MRDDSITDTNYQIPRDRFRRCRSEAFYRTRASSVKNSRRDCHPNLVNVLFVCTRFQFHGTDGKGESINGSGGSSSEKKAEAERRGDREADPRLPWELSGVGAQRRLR
jgi:hypothetical protein